MFLSNVFEAIKNIAQSTVDFAKHNIFRTNGYVDLKGKLILIDNDELLLVWESGLRDRRLAKEKEAWDTLERRYGPGSPQVVETFVKWQEQLYAYIEQEKERFLKQRQGSTEGLNELLRMGVITICVTKGAKPYTQKCFDLVGLSTSISDVYSPEPGKREKRFVDAVHDYGIYSSVKCAQDTLIVGHDLDKDMAWDLVPPKGGNNDGNAPVFVMFDTMAFDRDVIAPLDALPEITAFLAKKGKNDFLRGFKSLNTSKKIHTKNYSFRAALYFFSKKSDKARIPLVYEIQKR